MKINTTKSHIASVNFHGANFTDPEWTFSQTDGSDLDLYSGACVFLGNKGDKPSYEWYIVAGEELVNCESKEDACEAFHKAAEFRCEANRKVEDPLGKDAAAVDAIVAAMIKAELSIN